MCPIMLMCKYATDCAPLALGMYNKYRVVLESQNWLLSNFFV